MKTFATLFLLLLCLSFAASAECPTGTTYTPSGVIICDDYTALGLGWICVDLGTCEPNQGCFDPTPGLCAPPIWLPQAVADRDRIKPSIGLPRKTT